MNSSGDEETSLSFKYAQSQSYLNAGFLSPLSNEKLSTNKELGFSPSIFLSRPDSSHTDSMPQLSSNSPPSSSVPIPISRSDSGSSHDHRDQSRHAQCSRPWSASPGYESDCPQGDASDQLNSSVGGNKSRDDFVTSTPIRVDKENQKRGNGSLTEEEESVICSPTVQHSISRKHLREPNDVSGFVRGSVVPLFAQAGWLGFCFHMNRWNVWFICCYVHRESLYHCLLKYNYS